MPITIPELRAEVNSLDDVSSRSDYETAFEHFVEVLRRKPQPDKQTMITILATFINTLSSDISPLLALVKRKASALDQALVSSTVGEIIEGINNRNPAFSRLNTTLQNEIDKGNADANLLKRIKEAVEKATNTIDEINNLVDQLTATNATTTSKIKSLIDAVGNITNIIFPNEH
jgi:methyl-accepting chemotaxis protein